jgi:hypothetical protein
MSDWLFEEGERTLPLVDRSGEVIEVAYTGPIHERLMPNPDPDSALRERRLYAVQWIRYGRRMAIYAVYLDTACDTEAMLPVIARHLGLT